MNERKLTAEELWERQKARLAAQAAKREQRRAQKASASPCKPMRKASSKSSRMASGHLTLVAVNGIRIRRGQNADKLRTECGRLRASAGPQGDLFATTQASLRATKPKRLRGGCLLYRLPARLRAMG